MERSPFWHSEDSALDKPRRFRALADLKLQGGIALRIIFYWALCQLGFALSVFSVWRLDGYSQDPGRITASPSRIIFAGVVLSLLLLPIALLDIIRYSNRFAGPLLRLRRGLARLAQGEDAQPIYFRKKDFLLDSGRDFNLVLERLNKVSGDVVESTQVLDTQPQSSPATAL